MQVATQSAAQYLKSRTRDAVALSHEIEETKGQLGYATFTNPCTVLVHGELNKFKTPEEARAFILRRFW